MIRPFRCKFEKDVTGIYILPIVGYSKVQGIRSFWVGWLYWLWMITWD